MQAVQDFIADYNLKRADGITAFEAAVKYHKKNLLHTIFSEVQIITIPKAMVLYILKFFKETYQMPEMYSTENFIFRYSKGGPLEIYDDQNNQSFIMSIQPALINNLVNDDLV